MNHFKIYSEYNFLANAKQPFGMFSDKPGYQSRKMTHVHSHKLKKCTPLFYSEVSEDPLFYFFFKKKKHTTNESVRN